MVVSAVVEATSLVRVHVVATLAAYALDAPLMVVPVAVTYPTVVVAHHVGPAPRAYAAHRRYRLQLRWRVLLGRLHIHPYRRGDMCASISDKLRSVVDRLGSDHIERRSSLKEQRMHMRNKLPHPSKSTRTR